MGNILQVGTLDIKGMDCIKRVYLDEGISPTLTTMEGGNRQPKILEENINNKIYQLPHGTNNGGIKAKDGVSPTITTVQKDNYLVEYPFRIRKFTPLECWRLMGFYDSDFYKAKKAGLSDTQLYKQAGNSICVGVLEAIFKNLFYEVEND